MIFRALLGVCCVAGVAAVHAADYPSKPIRILVPFVPGGATDILARLVGQNLTIAWEQQVVIDNRPGANGILAADITAKATPDGHTLLFVAIGHAINPLLQKNLPYDTQKDFTPVSLAAVLPLIVCVHPSLPANSVKELIALAKSRKLNYASGGVGSSQHLATALFASMAKIDLVHIPYKGAGPAFTDLLGGHFQIMFPTLQSAVPHIKSGRLRLLALTSEKRSPAFPDTPVMEEAGVPGVIAVAWFGIHAPKATPQAVIARLHAEAVKVLQDPVVKQRFATEGADAVGSSPAQFVQFISNEIAKWTKVVKDGGITPQ